MSGAELIVHAAGPAVTVQDHGRPGYLVEGLGRGGAMDRLALAEGAALLAQPAAAALEMAGMGGGFEATRDLEIALTGAPMAASIGGAPVAWNACHLLPAGARLEIGAVQGGSYGYLHVAGGIATPAFLGSRSAHLVAGIGRAVAAGDRLPLGDGAGVRGRAGLCLEVEPRCAGGVLRLLAGPQTGFFPADELARFADTEFTRDPRGNRMGIRLNPAGAGFMAGAGLTIVSEVILPGDVQVTGDGAPYVLMAECQTTGGYPRIGTVIGADLPLAAQAPPGAALRFAFLTIAEAVDAEARARQDREALASRVRPMLREPGTVADLLSYQLIGGVVSATDPPQR